jgi:uncharacterized protein DUF6789
MRPRPGRAIVAGFAATTAMTLALYVLVSVLAGEPLRSDMLGGAVAWMPALVLQFVNGSITLPLIYVYLGFRFLPGEPGIRGALWGVILWGLTEILVMPLMRDALSGVTSIGATAVLVFGLLLVFLVYGTLLGLLAGAERSRPGRLPEAERLAA